jgi:hypothetical protein
VEQQRSAPEGLVVGVSHDHQQSAGRHDSP